MNSGRLLPLIADGAGLDFAHIFRHIWLAVRRDSKAPTSSLGKRRSINNKEHGVFAGLVLGDQDHPVFILNFRATLF
jgi:hypothetical protein